MQTPSPTLPANLHAAAALLLPSVFLDDEDRKQTHSLMEIVTILAQETGYMHIQATKPDTVGKPGGSVVLQWRHINVSTLRAKQNDRRFADDTFKRILLNENVIISIKISLKFIPKGSINNTPALVQIMAWRRPGDESLSESMMVRLPTYICVTRPQCLKESITTRMSVNSLIRLTTEETPNFVMGIRRWPLDSPHKWSIMRCFDVYFAISLSTNCDRNSRFVGYLRRH